ncbi:MAG: hypothetical protein KME13_11835 [Myxacorys californica WJT36-NPBG1]|jgi:hypothetical protein|nr:hypothetical protein [Myxacorys californica WJT36-NPBG1]
MISSSHPSHNRLFDLEQSLLGWKQSAYGSRSELPQTEHEQTPVLSDRLELEDEGDYEDDYEYEDENETANQYEDEQVTDDAAELFSSSVARPDWFSYRSLANRLESRTRGLEYNMMRQQLRDAAVEADDLLLEPSFFSDSHSGAATAGQPDEEHLLPLAFSATDPSTEQPLISETDAFNLPDIDLPDIDLPDIDLPDADLPTSTPPPRTDGSGDGSSYGSLLQMMQSARGGDPSADFEDASFATAQTTRTIDVEAQAIADLQDDWDDPLPDLFDTTTTPIPPPPNPKSLPS